MKKLFLSALLLASVGVAFTSCNNGEYDTDPLTNNSGIPNPNNTGNGGGTGMSAKINGVQWNASYAQALDLIGISLSLNGVSGQGTNDGKIMLIGLFNYTGIDTYAVDGVITQAAWTAGAPGTPQIDATSGEVIVTDTLNNRVKGTFHWDGPNISVTEGKFDMPKQ
jgi:hypothetical protein